MKLMISKIIRESENDPEIKSTLSFKLFSQAFRHC